MVTIWPTSKIANFFSKDPTKGKTGWWVQDSCPLRISPVLIDWLLLSSSLRSVIKGGSTARVINSELPEHLMKNPPQGSIGPLAQTLAVPPPTNMRCGGKTGLEKDTVSGGFLSLIRVYQGSDNCLFPESMSQKGAGRVAHQTGRESNQGESIKALETLLLF